MIKVIKLKRIGLLFPFFILLLVLVMVTPEKVNFALAKSLKPIYSVKTKTPQVAITFDISWGEQYVEPILKALAEEEIIATFFISSPWAEQEKDIVKQIISKGHEIGSHGRRHVDLNTLDEETLITELTSSRKVLEEITGQKITLLRTPNGAYDNKVIDTANTLGYRVIQWSVDSLDWKKPGTDIIINNVLNGRSKNKGAGPGDIILFHASDSAPETAAALPQVLKALKAKNLEIVPVSELLENGMETCPPESNL